MHEQHEQRSAAFHLDWAGRIPAGHLIYADDREGGVVDLYFHPRHIRAGLVWQLNHIGRQHVTFGLWRQRWTHEGRMQEPTEGLGVAVSRWEIVSAHKMPTGLHVFPSEQDGSCIWLIRSGSCSQELADQWNGVLERIAGDGLWLQAWAEGKRIPARPATLMPIGSAADLLVCI